MCCLFGILDLGKTLTVRQRTKTLSILAEACEARGTDATGIAYNTGGKLCIYKRPKAAHKMWFRLPCDSNVIMGHTRMTTKGDERLNYNNHPFYGEVRNTPFALAHNGIIINDDELKKKYHFPKTVIETDSYAAVQLMEQQEDLSLVSLVKIAEELEGTFSLTLLDNGNNVYFVKGNNPICLYYWRERNLYIYASTEEILKNALSRIPYYFGAPEKVKIDEGDILRIDNTGERTVSQFSTQNLYYGYYAPYSYYMDSWDIKTGDKELTYKEMLQSIAHSFGYSDEDIDDLLASGFTLEDIEAIFYEDAMYC